MSVRHAVFPIAGHGRRLAPVTRSVPKAFLPILCRPLLHEAMIEARISGIEHFIVITDDDPRRIVEGYFQPPFDDERDELEWIARRTVFVRQDQARGLGDAVFRARDIVGSSPFAVILVDDVLFSDPPFLTRMIQAHGSLADPVSIIACEEVAAAEVSDYGILDLEEGDGTLARVRDLVEKPPIDRAPSRMAIIGRYILPPEIFPAIADTRPGSGGEIQLTDALRALGSTVPAYACRWEGRRHDCGSAEGLATANLEAALRQAAPRSSIRRRILDILDAEIPRAKKG